MQTGDVKFSPQTMDIVDMAIHPVVCQKSVFHGNCDFQVQKLYFQNK
jgi:hypothetical protein